MRFHKAVDFLFGLDDSRENFDTDPTAELLSHLGEPHRELTSIQVAGTNGKGSTARMTERVLREAGLDVGLYSSPHLTDVRERVQVNGRCVPKEAVVEFAERLRDYVSERDGGSPSFFEAVTALACWYFARREVDVAILEVGIGGKLDATSAVNPIASAVTSVSLEHVGVLGDSIDEIARDQAHVEPNDGPLVTAAEGRALDAVRAVADDVITVGGDDWDGGRKADPDVRAVYRGRTGIEGAVDVRAVDWRVETRLSLLGPHQARNAGVAATLARQVADVSETELARGLRAARWPGRFEVLGREPLVVLDGAHNPAACESVTNTLREFDYDDLHLVVGAMADKDYRGMVSALPDADRVVTCQPGADRAESPGVLAELFERNGAPEVATSDTVERAVDRALEAAGPDDCVVVTGSLHVVAEARNRWTRVQIPKRTPTPEDAREMLERAGVTETGIRRASGATVHRTLKTRVPAWQADRLKESMLSVGGECVVSGIRTRSEEYVNAVLTGTTSQFERLADELDGRSDGLGHLADEFRHATDRDSDTGGDFPWEDGTAVMGILNVTPDSFHDGGEYDTTEDAVARAEEMIEAGADIIDVGGEATNPDVDATPVEAERDRVVPVVERIRDLDALVSVDTRKAEVARAALEAGADIINDVSGLEDPEMPFVAAEYDAPLIVMHSINTPVDRSDDPPYDDVVEDVIDELSERVLLAERAGLDRDRIIVDPGVGFGKTAEESFELVGRLDELRALGCPVLLGHSRKSMFGRVDCYPDDGAYATAATTALAADRGVDIVRVHDVPENAAAVRAAEATDGRTGEDKRLRFEHER